MQNNENAEEIICKCPNCGASMKMHWHRISKGLANSLVKFRIEVIKRNRNKIHIKNEINFSKTEFNNFQKLRYHGLVAKYVNLVSKQHEGGYWLLTKRGNLFCKNQLQIPCKVQTFRNKISDKALDLIFINEVLKGTDQPIWDTIENFDFDFADITEIEDMKTDRNGQGIMFLEYYASKILRLNMRK